MTTKIVKADKATPNKIEPRLFCCYCGVPLIDCNYTIDQPPVFDGPDLPLCYQCGEGQLPYVQEIHNAIIEMDPLARALLEQAIIRYEQTRGGKRHRVTAEPPE